MDDIIQKMLALIKEESSINEIAESLSLSNQEIYQYLNILKNKGFDFDRKYYYSGDIVYLQKSSVTPPKGDYTNIYTTEDDTQFKALLISDLHLGNQLERPDILDILFNYCKKESINIIICGGDFIDGLLTGSGKKIYTSSIEAIDYALERYPFDKNILTFTILGNHDISVFDKTGQDFAKVLENNRHDIISLGYGKGELHIKNDFIVVRHKLTADYKIPNPEIKTPALVVQGHSHGTKIKMTHTDLCMVTIPTCSDIKTQDFIPGAIKMSIEFDNGNFDVAQFEQLAIDNNNVIRLNEIECSLSRGKIVNDTIALEEYRPKRLIKK